MTRTLDILAFKPESRYCVHNHDNDPNRNFPYRFSQCPIARLKQNLSIAVGGSIE